MESFSTAMRGPSAITTPAGDTVDVILRDGTTLRLRSPGRVDAEALLEFFRRLSPESRYQRFHGVRSIDETVVETFVEPDWQERGALVGTLSDPGGAELIVALGSFARLRDPTLAEVAFVVRDDLRGRGIGTRLLEQLAERAGGAGIEEFVAEVLPANAAMLGVFGHAGFEVTRQLDEGEVEIRFPIAPTQQYLARVDERDHVAVAASLRPFFEPRSVAVIGASRRTGSIGGELFRNILRAEFTGSAYPVNRRAEPVAGVPACSSVEDIPAEIDLAVVCLPGEQVLDAAEAALRKGVRALCVISAGFAEMGEEGLARQERLLALVRAHGARLVGPNCLGIASSPVRLNATFGPRALPPGTIGFSSQSGALGLALLEHAADRGLGFSSFVSIGNKADVSSNDLLEYWEEDDTTSMILLYLESFGNPRRFSRIARRVAGAKPLLALKSGTTSSGAQAASSHTAAMAGSDEAVDALFHEAGVLRARTLEELLDAASLLSTQPLPRGRRVALVTNAGGLGILCADACDAADLKLATLSDATTEALRAILPLEASLANPVDMLGSATAETYAHVLPPVLADPRVDAVIALFVPPVHAGAREVADAIAGVAPSDKPLLAVVVSEQGIPAALRGTVASFPYPESAAAALGLAAKRADWLRRPAGSVPELEGLDRAAAEQDIAFALESSPDDWLDPAATRGLLRAYGIPIVSERLAQTIEEAVAAAGELGFPVVVKTAEPGAHKTETGGVALDLADEDAVREAVERIGPPVIVQPMLRGDIELLAGLVQDPVFGPLVAVGPGGIFAELIGHAEFRLAPLTDVDAMELLRGGKVGTLVSGYRGLPAADTGALADLLHRLSRLAIDLPAVAELDLNPVFARPDGCIAVDARVRVRRPEPTQRTKTW